MQKLKDIKQKILPVLEGGEVLIIVPPFGSIIDIALGPHTLQALAEEKGHKLSILYLNMLLASIIGVEHYEEICNAPLYQMLGERLFARSAYGLSPLGNNPGCCTNEAMSIRSSEPHQKMFFDTPLPFDLDKYLQLERICQYFLDEVITVITSLDYKIIGCSTFMTGQINCSIALLNGVKQNHPGTITIIGGPNCKGEMSEGIASLSHAIDFIFSGESETTFLDFLEAYSLKKFPSQRIIKGEPLADLDSLPLPGYEIFSQQYGHFLGKSSFQRIKIWYETSRGCWWGQKSRCTFCSEDRLTYTVKSINKVVSDLERINKIYPGNMICIADNIMPHSYQHDLLPVISQRKEFPSLAYHLKVNYNLQNLVQLKKARIRAILPGIETFSENLLRLMNKGISGRQSLLFLRNVMSVGIYADWFLLWGVPGDSILDYNEILRILPLIQHLQPPRLFMPIILMRFSTYLENQKDYGIKNVRPWAVYNMVYPDWARVDKLAYWYIADYPCEANKHPEIIREIANGVTSWKKKWKYSKLEMTHFMNTYVIYDNRDIHKKVKTHILDYRQAKEIMTSCLYGESESLKWAVSEKLGLVLDSWYVPLVTAAPGLLLEFEDGLNPEGEALC